MRAIALVILFFLYGVIGFSQAHKKNIDSLQRIADGNGQNEKTIQACHEMFLALEFTDTLKAKSYLEKAHKLAVKTGDKKNQGKTYKYFAYYYEDLAENAKALWYYQKALPVCKAAGDKKILSSLYIGMGNIHKNTSSYFEALDNYNIALKLAKAVNYQKDISAAYNNIGIVYTDLGNYPEALKNYFASLNIKTIINDKLGEADSYNNVGLIYMYQLDFKKALKYLTKTLKSYEKLKDSTAMSISYNNIGLAHQRLKNYEKALHHFEIGLALNLKTNNPFQISTSYNNLSTVYNNLGEMAKDPTIKMDYFDKALACSQKAYEMREAIGDRSGMAISSVNLGISYVNHNKFKEARKWFEKALQIATEIRHKAWIKHSYEQLYLLDSVSGNFKSAFENHRLSEIYTDSIDNEETRKETFKNQLVYEFEKKEAIAQMSHQKKLKHSKAVALEKSRQRNLILVFAIAGIGLVFIFAMVILRSLRKTRKQQLLIEEQKLEVERQKNLVDAKQKELMDSIYYARRIQFALLPNKKYIEKHLNK